MDHIRANYNSSESDSNEESDQEPVFRFPEIPEAILDKYHLKPRTSSGMKPQGFTSFVYLEWKPSRVQNTQLTRIVNQFNATCHQSDVESLRRLRFEPLYYSSLGSPEPLHVSLTRLLEFEDESQRDAFYRLLGSKLLRSPLVPFEIGFEPSLQVLDSRFKDRTFLTIPVVSKLKCKQFKALSNLLSECLRSIFPHRDGQEIDSMVCPAQSAHMSIALAQGASSSSLVLLAQAQKLSEPTPTWTVNHMKFDKNRESLKVLFPPR